MMTKADVVRIHSHRHASPLMGWLMILIIAAGGFSALAYALGKYAGMQVCR